MSDMSVTKANNMRRIRCWGKYGVCGVFKSQSWSRWEVWSHQVRRSWGCGPGRVRRIARRAKTQGRTPGSTSIGEERDTVEERE